jgi:hypothetical protein
VRANKVKNHLLVCIDVGIVINYPLMHEIMLTFLAVSIKQGFLERQFIASI